MAAGTKIPFVDFGGSGPNLVFLHANGYPPACYAPLLKQLSVSFHAIAMLLRPLWKNSQPEEVDSWNLFSDDLIRFLDERELPSSIALGHSLGATVALRACLAAPGRFVALILLDPVLLPRRVMLAWWIARALGLGYFLHPKMRGAASRRRSFDDLAQVFEGYRRRRIFRYVFDEGLRAYIRGMTSPAAGGGYDLIYSPEWESRVYYTGSWNDWDLWTRIPQLRVPTLIIRGAESDTFLASTADTVRAKNPGIKIVALKEATHLVPLERPGEVCEHVQEFVSRALVRGQQP